MTASLAAALGAATRIAEPRQTWKSHVAMARLHGSMTVSERARARYAAAYAAWSRWRQELRPAGFIVARLV